jgi:hypothetical protein
MPLLSQPELCELTLLPNPAFRTEDPGKSIDEPDFDKIWEAAESRDRD